MNIITSDIYNLDLILPVDLQGWNGQSPIFEELISQLKPNLVIEVGTWKGQSAITIANALKKNSIVGKIYCIDTWLGALEFWGHLKDTKERYLMLKNGYPQIYYQFISNVIHTDNQQYIIPFPNTSTIGFRFLKSENVTSKLIYIDASHDREDVLQDLNNYYELLEPGGVMFGDDFYNFDGVNLAVNDFCMKHNISYDIKYNNFWLIRK